MLSPSTIAHGLPQRPRPLERLGAVQLLVDYGAWMIVCKEGSANRQSLHLRAVATSAVETLDSSFSGMTSLSPVTYRLSLLRPRRRWRGGFLLTLVWPVGTILSPRPQVLRRAGQIGHGFKELGHVSLWAK